MSEQVLTGVAWFVGVVSVFVAPLSSQVPAQRFPASDATVQRLLTSSDPRDQAWGAWIVGTEDRAEFVPLVEQLLRRHAEPATWLDEAARDSALDALIQLPSEPPAELVVPLLSVRPTEALILISRLTSGGDTELISLLETETRDTWYAAANILVKRRTKGTARVMLNRLLLTVNVAVKAPGQDTGPSPPCSGRFPLGCSVDDSQTCSGAPEGFPPAVTYQVSRAGLPRDVMLSKFPVPVYYRRLVGTRCEVLQREDATHLCPIDPTEHLVSLAGSLPPSLAHSYGLVSSVPLPVPAAEHKCVTWYGQDEFDAELEHFRQLAAQDYAELVRALVAHGTLAAEEVASLRPRLSIRVRDRNGLLAVYTSLLPPPQR